MSTRSIISIKTDDGFMTVYCHFDGYLAGVGETLKNNYGSIELAMALIQGGDMSSLGESIGVEHSPDNRNEPEYENMTTFYHRDRGESWEMVAPRMLRFFADVYNDAVNSLAEYLYVFIDGEWKYTRVNAYNWGEWKYTRVNAYNWSEVDLLSY